MNLKPYEQAIKDMQSLMVVCGHVASCDDLSCPRRRPHAVFACPIMGLHPAGICKIAPQDKLRCVLLNPLVVVHKERLL